MARALRPGGAFSSPRRRPPASATLCGRRVCLSSGAGRLPLLCGEGGSHTRAALGRLLPNVPVGLELGVTNSSAFGGRAGDKEELGWAYPEGRACQATGCWETRLVGTGGDLGWICRSSREKSHLSRLWAVDPGGPDLSIFQKKLEIQMGRVCNL